MLQTIRWSKTPSSALRPVVFQAVLIAFLMLASSSTSEAQSRDQDKASFERKFWKYLVGNNYKNWSPGPNQSSGFYKGQNPHGSYLKMYINRTAAGSIGDLKLGSVVILENYMKDQTLKTISVMYRTTGFNPSANDWYWVEYKPDGSVVVIDQDHHNPSLESKVQQVSYTVAPKLKLMGKATQCINCHQSAGGNDFMFSNDQLALGAPQVEKDQQEEDDGDLFVGANQEDFFGSR